MPKTKPEAPETPEAEPAAVSVTHTYLTTAYSERFGHAGAFVDLTDEEDAALTDVERALLVKPTPEQSSLRVR